VDLRSPVLPSTPSEQVHQRRVLHVITAHAYYLNISKQELNKKSQLSAIILQQYFSWIENKITKPTELVS
jgi:hypothetical protein